MPELTSTQRILGILGFAIGSAIIVGGACMFGLLMLAFSTDGCGGGANIDYVFVVWMGLCLVVALVPPVSFLLKSNWKYSLFASLGGLALLVVGLVASFVLIIQACS